MPDATRALSTDEVRARGDSIRACVLASLAVRAKPAAATRDGELHFLVIEAGRAWQAARPSAAGFRRALSADWTITDRHSVTRATRASGRRVDHHTARARPHPGAVAAMDLLAQYSGSSDRGGDDDDDAATTYVSRSVNAAPDVVVAGKAMTTDDQGRDIVVATNVASQMIGASGPDASRRRGGPPPARARVLPRAPLQIAREPYYD